MFNYNIISLMSLFNSKIRDNYYSTSPPALSILPYFNTYTSTPNCSNDPSGWVVCDGVKRTVTDSRFTNIYASLNTIMGVESNTANEITPPDLRSRFLYGASATNTIGGTGGSSSVTLETANIPSHSHTTDFYCNRNGAYQGGNSEGLFGNNFFDGSQTVTKTSSNTGSGTAFSILPPYIALNYIMKY
jgi:microcystin-dependent protein